MKKLLIGVLCFILLISFSGCHNTIPKGLQTGKIYENEFPLLFERPKDFIDRDIQISGTVSNNLAIVKGRLVFDMAVKVNDRSETCIIRYKNTNIDIREGDYIKVEGTVQSPFKTSLLGKTPVIDAQSLEILNISIPKEDILKEISLYKTIDQDGQMVTINKVQFTNKETLVYATVGNYSTKKFKLYNNEAVLIQNGITYKNNSDEHPRYTDLRKDLGYGEAIEAILTFPIIEQKNFQIQIIGTSDKGTELPPYLFNIVVE